MNSAVFLPGKWLCGTIVTNAVYFDVGNNFAGHPETLFCDMCSGIKCTHSVV